MPWCGFSKGGHRPYFFWGGDTEKGFSMDPIFGQDFIKRMNRFYLGLSNIIAWRFHVTWHDKFLESPNNSKDNLPRNAKNRQCTRQKQGVKATTKRFKKSKQLFFNEWKKGKVSNFICTRKQFVCESFCCGFCYNLTAAVMSLPPW